VIPIVGLREDIVNDDVTLALEGTARDEDKRAKRVIARIVHAVEDFETGAKAGLLDDWRRDSYSWQLAQRLDIPGRHRGAAKRGDEAGAGRHHDDVGADAIGADFLAVDLAKEDGRDGQNHDDFDGDGCNGDDRAQRAVNEVGEYELIHSDVERYP